MMMQWIAPDVMYAEGWVPGHMCKHMLTAASWVTEPEWRKDLQVWRPDFARDFPDVWRALERAREEIQGRIHVRLRMINPVANHWPPGCNLALHSDFGAEGEFPDRDWTTIIYLNDIHEDGCTFIPERGLEVRPRRGAMLSFPGGDLEHGGHPCSVSRYTITCWWGVNPE